MRVIDIRKKSIVEDIIHFALIGKSILMFRMLRWMLIQFVAVLIELWGCLARSGTSKTFETRLNRPVSYGSMTENGEIYWRKAMTDFGREPFKQNPYPIAGPNLKAALKDYLNFLEKQATKKRSFIEDLVKAVEIEEQQRFQTAVSEYREVAPSN